MKESLPGELLSLREEAMNRRDPTASDDVFAYLLNTVWEKKPHRILEIGAAEGLTTVSMLLSSEARATAIEMDPQRAAAARENFVRFGVEDRATLYEGDAGEILSMLGGEYDVIFLDGPKVQYRRYFPDCKRLLSRGGVLLSDDVLLFGWVTGEAPPKRRMLAEHIREYLSLLKNDESMETTVLSIGEGLAFSVKK